MFWLEEGAPHKEDEHRTMKVSERRVNGEDFMARLEVFVLESFTFYSGFRVRYGSEIINEEAQVKHKYMNEPILHSNERDFKNMIKRQMKEVVIEFRSRSSGAEQARKGPLSSREGEGQAADLSNLIPF